MDKKIKIIFCVLFSSFLFNSCFYIVSDRPYYYSDYEDPETSASYNYYYSYSYSNYSAVVSTHTPTPVPTKVIVKQTDIYIILKVIDNRHIFYRNNKEIAVWYFHPDGRIERKGEDINGKVIRYYDNSDIIEWEFEYKNNLRWGQCRRYFNNGKIWEEIYYNQGKRDGTYKIYYPDGKIKEEVKYKDGSRDGIYRIYHDDGKIIERGNYKQNKKEVKFRDEKYFKDKRDEVLPEPAQQIKIQPTPIITPTIDNKQYEDRGLKFQKPTPYKYKDEDKGKEEGKIKESKQDIDTEKMISDEQKERGVLKTKKNKDNNQKSKFFKAKEQMIDRVVEEKQNYKDVTLKATEDVINKGKDKDEDEDKDKDKGKDKDKDKEEGKDKDGLKDKSKEKIWGKEKEKK